MAEAGAAELPAEPAAAPAAQTARSWRSLFESTEIDTRLVGMILSLAVIWIAFHVLSGGDFLTARNLWNLSVQSSSIAIMATGMVLIIVSRRSDGRPFHHLLPCVAIARVRPPLRVSLHVFSDRHQA